MYVKHATKLAVLHAKVMEPLEGAASLAEKYYWELAMRA